MNGFPRRKVKQSVPLNSRNTNYSLKKIILYNIYTSKNEFDEHHTIPHVKVITGFQTPVYYCSRYFLQGCICLVCFGNCMECKSKVNNTNMTLFIYRLDIKIYNKCKLGQRQLSNNF